MLAVAAPASASTAQVVPGVSPLNGVACPSATTCVAVGDSAVVTITNGTVSAPQAVSGTNLDLLGVACPTATTCVAVGENASFQGMVVPITNGTPGTAVVVPGTVGLEGVACPSATTCIAVGFGSGVVVPITNGTPGTPQAVPGAPFLFGVACPSATTCIAVGNNDFEGVVVPITNGTPGSPQMMPSTPFLTGVACASITTCVAVGNNAAAGGVGGAVVPITNGTVGIPQVVPTVNGVACPSATSCIAVGFSISGQGQIVPITNGTVGAPQAVSGTNLDLLGVACPRASTCVAVGEDVGLQEGVVAVLQLRAGPHVPLSVALCEHGGWQSLTNVQGQPFKNQGQCISYFIHNPVSLADLAGSFSGTEFPAMPEHECSPSGGSTTSFFATYPGSSAVGTVTLDIEACGPALGPSTVGGLFTIATSVGTLVGDVSGTFVNELTLTVSSGSEAFSATTGAIHVSIQELPGGTYREIPVTMTVTIP